MSAVDGGALRVVVFGGTGRTGRLIVEHAVRAGHAVTVATRRPGGVPDLELPESVRIVRADVHDPATVGPALRDQDALVLAISAPDRHPGALYSDAARNIIAAVDGTPLSRAIVISSGGVYDDDPALPFWYRRLVIPLVMKDLYDDMRVMESLITGSNLDWTVVRASYLQDRPATGRYRVADGSTPARGWKLSRADLAAFTVDQLSSDVWLCKTPTLAN